jgi:twinkle protein
VEYRDLVKRGITKATCEWYNYGIGKLADNSVAQVAQWFDEHGELITQKYRFPTKAFKIVGITRAETIGLWGDVTEDRSCVVITEGELDAMSVFQATGISALSVPLGANSTTAAIKGTEGLLAEFKKVIVFFDQDSQGEEGAKKAVNSLHFHPNVHVVKAFPYKDANEALMSNDTQAICKALQGAVKEDVGQGLQIVKPSVKLLEKVMQPIDRGPTICYPILNEMLGGYQLEEMCVVFALTGKGKTTLVKELIYDLIITHNKKVGGLFLEEDDAGAMRGFIALDNNVSLKRLQMFPGSITPEAYMTSFNKFKDNLSYFCDTGGDTIETIKAKMEHLIVVEKCDYLVYDNISYTMQGLGTDDERKAIDSITYVLKGLQIKYQVGILLVVQKKQGVQSALGARHKAAPDDAGYINSVTSDIKGSSGPAATAGLVIALDEHQSILNFRRINVLKNRKGQSVGPADELMFDPDTGRLVVNDTTKDSMF